MKEYKVFVKQEYIDDFIKNKRRFWYCPLMKAINEQTELGCTVFKDRIEFVEVNRNLPMNPISKEIDFTNFFKFKSIKIEYARALEFIERCDSGKNLKPFEFIFNI